MSLVALPPAAIDASLVMGVTRHDPDRLISVVQFLAENEIPFVPSEILDGEGVKVQFVKRSYARVSADTADSLDSEERSQCIAIEGSEDLARPRSGVIHPEVRVVFKGLCLSLRLVDGHVEAILGSDKAVFTPTDNSTVDELFADGMVNVSSPYNPNRRVFPRGAISGKLSHRLTEIIAEWMQDLSRVHVLCTAAGSEPRPCVLECADMFQNRPDINERAWRTYINATFHPSSASCICPAHNRPRRQGKVRVSIRFCGRVLENGVCPTHPQSENQGDHVCTAHLSVNLLCKHVSPPDGIKVCIPFGVARDAMVKIAEAAVVTIMDATVEDAVMPDVEAAMEEAREEAKSKKPVANEERDLRALHLLRTHSAIRKNTGRLGRMHGQTESWLAELSGSYGHLFPAHPTQVL